MRQIKVGCAVLSFALPAEYLASVDDQVSKAGACRQKFSDDDTHKRKADVDIHDA